MPNNLTEEQKSQVFTNLDSFIKKASVEPLIPVAMLLTLHDLGFCTKSKTCGELEGEYAIYRQNGN